MRVPLTLAVDVDRIERALAAVRSARTVEALDAACRAYWRALSLACVEARELAARRVSGGAGVVRERVAAALDRARRART